MCPTGWGRIEVVEVWNMAMPVVYGRNASWAVLLLGVLWACSEGWSQDRGAKLPTVSAVERQLTQSTGAGGAEDPAILQSADGRIWVAWYDRDEKGRCHLWCQSTRDGETWSPTVQVTRNPEGDNWYPSLIQASDEALCLAWFSGRTRNAEVWFSESSDGESWSEARQITSDPGHDWAPSLAQSSDGTCWIAWSSDGNTRKQKDIWVSRSQDRKSWSEPVAVVQTELSEDFPSLIPSGPKGIRLAYTAYTYRGEDPSSLGNESSEVYLAESKDGATWSKPQRLTENKVADLLPCLVCEPNGAWSIFWTSSTTDPTGDTLGIRCAQGKRSKPHRLTTYVGEDYSPRALRAADGTYWTVWVSNRSGKRNIWVGTFKATEWK